MTNRQTILDLFSGKKTASQPAFSGLIHITAEGLQSERITLQEAHHDARKMARAAASTYRLTGMPSAALPLDLCAPAETLGAELNFYQAGENRFPQVKRPLLEGTREIASGLIGSPGIVSQKGRSEIICEAITLVADKIGKEVVISGTIPGPYTLLLYICNPNNLFLEMRKEPQMVLEALFHLSSFLAQVGIAYRNAGADFITIHDMGGSPGFIGPARYEQFVYPAEKLLMTELPSPRVLSVCGNTNKSMSLLAQTGAEAISVDQTNDLAASRKILTDTLLFGNLDPVGTLWDGRPADIREAVRAAKEAGVDAVWPGCDLVPPTPVENLKAFLRS